MSGPVCITSAQSTIFTLQALNQTFSHSFNIVTPKASTTFQDSLAYPELVSTHYESVNERPWTCRCLCLGRFGEGIPPALRQRNLQCDHETFRAREKGMMETLHAATLLADTDLKLFTCDRAQRSSKGKVGYFIFSIAFLKMNFIF